MHLVTQEQTSPSFATCIRKVSQTFAQNGVPFCGPLFMPGASCGMTHDQTAGSRCFAGVQRRCAYPRPKMELGTASSSEYEVLLRSSVSNRRLWKKDHFLGTKTSGPETKISLEFSRCAVLYQTLLRHLPKISSCGTEAQMMWLRRQ